jgi:16S rRNA (cytosine1402-N4)-methyltransferase
LARLHRPVLVGEVVELLRGEAVVVDATVGAGGHAEALLESGVRFVLGVDRDGAALAEAEAALARFGTRVRLVRARFSSLEAAARDAGVEGAGGVLFDLGVSSMQLDRSDRGFSYREGGPLDMRMGAGDGDARTGEEGEGLTAADVVNTYPEAELARIVFEYGQDRYSRRIAAAIVRARGRAPIETTAQLAAIVASAVPRRRGGPHPARRTFQAIRIEVNAELEELAASLPQAASLLEPGGRLVVIAYHSLEDRIVKRFLAAASAASELRPLTRKPVRPSQREQEANPRARSARLRAAERPREEAA